MGGPIGMSMSWTEKALAERPGFRRGPDGRIVVRRAFGSDWVALALSVLVPLAYLSLLVGYAALLVMWMAD